MLFDLSVSHAVNRCVSVTGYRETQPPFVSVGEAVEMNFTGMPFKL